ncbi:MFS transporter [Desulfovibrio ferrophilus]|uniref:Inner membrane transport protein n=1 Tax=Desulfovibrio ferrophilus TaxID=241368 RepID=A0A2Z6AYB1_9BACT|nr:MFS transporter [Desulfovibrio ferrophilus]BBD08254.1 inner membrane transport protein [Desulfovibrio ferrophilus]
MQHSSDDLISNKRSRKSRILRGRLVAAALIVLVLASGFNLLLHLSSLEKMWIETLSDGGRVVAADLQANIGRSVRYGKRIDKFVGMDSLLDEAMNNLVRQDPRRRATLVGSEKDDQAVWRIDVINAGGLVLYSSEKERQGKRVEGVGDISSSLPFETEISRIVPEPIHDVGGNAVGAVLVSFRKDAVSGVLKAMAHDELLVGGVVFVAAAILFWLSLFLILPRERMRLAKALNWDFLKPRPKSFAFPRKSLMRAMLIAVLVCQVTYALYAASVYRDTLHEIVRGKVTAVSSILRDDLQYLLGKGVQLERLKRVEEAMVELLGAVTEAEAMVVADKAGKILFEAGDPGALERDGGMPVRVSIVDESGRSAGSIATIVPADIFRTQLRNVALDSLTILVIALLFAMEVTILVLGFFERTTGRSTGRRSYAAVRPAGFLLLFGADSSLSFIPLHMKALHGSFMGIPQEMLIALPISVEMFSAGLMIALSGSWIDRKGWRQPLLIGLGICVAGFIASWSAGGPGAFVAARGLVGMGYGLALMAMQGFIVQYSDENHRATGFSQFWAGVYAGSVCGVAAGALVAQQVGYGPVFLFGAVILVLALLYGLTAMAGIGSGEDTAGAALDSAGMRLGYGGFLLKPKVLLTVLLANIPAALAVIGLLNYFTPIYLSGEGVSQGDIGRIFMLNSIAIILMAQLTGSRIDKSKDKRGWVAMAGLLGAAAFLCFSVVQGVLAVAVAVVLLGFSSCIALSAIGAYVLGLDESEELGKGRATAVVASTYRVGQVLGPVAFGWLAAFDIKVAMPIAGGVYLVVTLLYPLVVKRVRA